MMRASQNPALRYDADQRSQTEREAIAGADAEERAQLRAIEREAGLGLARQCGNCSEWISLWAWRDAGPLCPICTPQPPKGQP